MIIRKVLPLFFLLLMGALKSRSQGCTTLGQTPFTAFPVCGSDTFHQASVPNCYNNVVPVPCTDNTTYYDYNPFWYQFTCYTAGTLGFLITPADLSDDYDWQLFDITGHNPAEVYTNPAIVVTGNWSATFGITGASASGSPKVECASDPAQFETTFSQMPFIKEGHTYLLLISHYSGSNQSGYSLAFSGGTAVITDPLLPAMQEAHASCTGESVYVLLNKKMKCTSLSKNGSEFSVSPALATVTSASAAECVTGFDMDSFSLHLNKALPAGNYSLIINNGSDSNTLLDDCDRNIAQKDSIAFTVYTLQPTPMDSLTPVACTPTEVQLVFRNRIRCNSIAPDGSDFIVKGTLPIFVISASGDSCADGLSNIIHVTLSQPVQTAGNYSITLQKGSDGNTIIDECAQETPPGATLPFITADTVSAAFTYNVDLGCVYDTLFYAHDGRNGVNEWNWTFDTDGVSRAEDSVFLFPDYGPKHIQLSISNGVCTDTSSADILLDNQLISRFSIAPYPTLCPEDAATFTDSSSGKIVSWYWIFGDGNTSTLQTPPPKRYTQTSIRDGIIYPTALIVKNDIGCFDTAQANLKVLYNCYIAVPTAFTPNGDGLNDFLYPLNAYKADNLEFRVFNRWGQLVFETKDRTQKWDGKLNGNPQAAGTYVWMLRYTDHDTGKPFSLNGTTVLIR